MTNIILSGHGNFATGLASAVKLIVGEQEHFTAIDFTAGLTPEDILSKMKEAVHTNQNEAGTVIFTDIPGGTPFNQAVLLSTQEENIHVIAGTNLPSIVEILFSRDEPVDAVVNKALEAGQKGLVTFEKKKKANENANDEDGI